MSTYKYFAAFGYKAGAQDGGVYRSQDGVTWSICPGSSTVAAAAGWCVIGQMQVVCNRLKTGLFFYETYYCWRSIDEGGTFAKFSPGLGGTYGYGGGVYPLAIGCDLITPGRTLIVSSDGKTHITIGGLAAGTVGDPITWLSSSALADIAGRVPTEVYWTSSGVYLSSSAGVYHATEADVATFLAGVGGGAFPWTKIRATNGINASIIKRIVWRNTPTQPMWAITQSGIYRCVMSGSAWTGVCEGEPAAATNYLTAPANSLANVYGVAFGSNYWYVCGGATVVGIYRAPISTALAGASLTGQWVAATVPDGAVGFTGVINDPRLSQAVWAQVCETYIPGKAGVYLCANAEATPFTFVQSAVGITTSHVQSSQQRSAPHIWGPSYTTTAPSITDPGDYGHICAVLDLDTKGWSFWSGLRCTSLAWDAENQYILGAGSRSFGSIYSRGGSVTVTLAAGSKALADLGRVRVHALEVDIISDENDITCSFIIDGEELTGRTLTTPVRGQKLFRATTTAHHATTFTSTGLGGYFDNARRQTLRFPCPVGGLGIVSGFKLTGTVGGEFTLLSHRLLYA